MEEIKYQPLEWLFSFVSKSSQMWEGLRNWLCSSSGIYSTILILMILISSWEILWRNTHWFSYKLRNNWSSLICMIGWWVIRRIWRGFLVYIFENVYERFWKWKIRNEWVKKMAKDVFKKMEELLKWFIIFGKWLKLSY
jgi:hypothetical protein